MTSSAKIINRQGAEIIIGTDNLWVKPDQIKLIEADVNEIAIQTVKFADTDGDNALNFDEFKQFYKNVLQITI